MKRSLKEMCFDKYKNFIFDLDGTILDTQGDILHCLELTFNDLKLPFVKERLIIGPPLKEIIKILLPEISEQLIEKAAIHYREYYNTSNYNHTKLYPNVLDFMNEVYNLEKKIFLATNKPTLSTHLILKKFGLFHLFSEILTPDFFSDKIIDKQEMLSYIISKQKLNKLETIMIGDSKSDIFAGQICEIDTAAYLLGYTPKDELYKANATFVFDKY